MMAILGGSALAVYNYTRHSLYEQLDLRLEVLAQAASHNLLPIKAHYNKRQQQGLAGKAPSSQTKCYLDYDGDLDIPWQELRQPDQGVEWFDAQKQLVGNAGKLFNKLPPQPGWQSWQQGKVRAVTLPAYSYSDGQKHLEGYIRTSQITQEIEAVLSRLRWGLGIGGIGVLGLTGLGGIWLTKQSLRPIEQSFQQLKQFTADAAHELRSPLAAMKTSVQVMQYYPERIHPQDLKKINAIASTTNHMIRLVEDLLLLARMDTIDLAETQQWIAVSLTEILEDLLELFQSQAQEKGITLQSNLLAKVKVKGDASQITRIFSNLLENALQYTPSGGTVTLSVNCDRENAIVTVEDTGIGIAPEHLPLIFDRFWREDKARSRRAGGMGMGLAIAQALVHHHQGEISVTSQLAVGSCFRVRLPLN
ncbi:MAG: HAMP domain-containing sensor histidine kinase [Stanieria sp.]